MNKTISLFQKYGMQSVSAVSEVPEYSNSVRFGNVSIEPSALDWVGRILQDSVFQSGIFNSANVEYSDIPAYTKEFYTSYVPNVPSELLNNLGSTALDGLLPLWIIAKCLRPKFYVESGVFVGASLRMFAEALPEAQIWAYDLSFKPLNFHGPHITYIENEWTAEPPTNIEGRNTLAFFDDHIDAVRRIKECAELGIRWIIFDDSPVLSRLNLYRYPCIPSIPLIMDEHIPDGVEIQWNHQSTKSVLSYRHDVEYCKSARKMIKRAVSLQKILAPIGINCGDKWIVEI